MSKLSRPAIVAAAVFATVASSSLGATHNASNAAPQRASLVSIRCQAAPARSTKMTHALWAIVRKDVQRKYAPALRGGVWRKMTSHPVIAYRVVNRWSHASAVAATCHPAAPAGQPVPLVSTQTTGSVPSGQAMPTGDIPGWHQVFADNFTQNVPLGQFPGAVSSSWGNSYPDGWKDTSGNGTYMPSKVVSFRNGVMNIHVHTQGGIHLIAAPVPTIPGAHGAEGGLLYGRYVIRIRTDVVPGYKAAMLLWPDSETWPRDGEIDFPEAQLDGTIDGFVHHQNGVSKNDQAIFTTTAAYTQWHTATVTWLPHEIAFQLDNQIVGIATTRIPDTPMHLVIQIETETNAPAPSNAAAGYVQIGWLAVYTPACNPLMSVVLKAAACTG
jgi:beta-glucanase (GH16 family)